MQAPELAARTQIHIYHDQACHEIFGGLCGLRVWQRHLQGQTRRIELLGFAGRCQRAIVANTLGPSGQHMLHEAAHKLASLQSLYAPATLVIGAHRERHLALADEANTLIADGCAVRVRGQIRYLQVRQTPTLPDRYPSINSAKCGSGEHTKTISFSFAMLWSGFNLISKGQ